eukprot:TRINITY_DN2832_c0_g1_i1.p2 TRINITY_DN2832_c0_g1~~TRINITY_DN2832_c0_g1_i1.p2  ORF type:complete len:206 (-),score=31.40 TRINITY_DN2832_c0_g1_i1:597-1214(-)
MSFFLKMVIALVFVATVKADDQKYSELPAVNLNVSVTYSTGGIGCSAAQAAENADGCAQLTWDNDDFLTVSWVEPTVAGATDVQVMRCFSKDSTVNRAWRKAKDEISKDKQCKKVGTVSVTGPQEYKYVIPSDAPEATYYTRLLVKCGEDFCGEDNSQSEADKYYSVKPMDSIPGGLVAGVVIAVIIAPSFLVLYFVYEFAILKK